MRIINGKYGGRKINPPSKMLHTRPTTDVAKEGLFNIIENCHVIKMDVFRFLESTTETYDLIFAGPPYALKNIDDLPVIIREKKLLHQNGWFILEHTPANNYEKYPLFKSSRNYGTTIFSIFINS